MGWFDRFRSKQSALPPPPKTEPVAVKKPAAKSEEEGKRASGAQAVGISPLSGRLLIRPQVSEKAAALAEAGTYVFRVPLEAEKVVIRKAVETLYRVRVTSVRTIRGAGKKVRRGRHPGQRQAWKKALVTLAKGQSINIYEGV